MKHTKLFLTVILVLALSASLFLAGCGSDSGSESAAGITDEQSAAPDTTGTPSQTAPDTAEQSSEAPSDSTTEETPYVNPLEGYAELPEDISVSNEEGGISMREHRFYKTSVYEKEDGTAYNWFQFYNACVRGELRLDDPAVLDYAEMCLEFFTEYDVPAQQPNAETLINAAKGLIGQ